MILGPLLNRVMQCLFLPRLHYMLIAILALAGLVKATSAGLTDEVLHLPLDHPAIQYDRPAEDVVADLNRKIQQGTIHLTYGQSSGYLRSVLDALNVPVESQMLVFSKTSAQARLISPQNPRSLYFNDAVTIGWVPG